MTETLRQGMRRMKHPMQPLVTDADGTVRFKENRIVRHLLDFGTDDMNSLARLPFEPEDYEQFAQLVGYSVGGFGELDYATEESVVAADRAAAVLLGELVDDIPPDTAQRIAALERKVAELEVLLQQLRDDHEDERHLR